MANNATRDAALKAKRKAEIEHDVAQFFNRYTAPVTADTILADALRFKKRIDPYAYKRIVAKATTAAPRPRPVARLTAPTTAAAVSSPTSGPDWSWIILAAAVAFALLRR